MPKKKPRTLSIKERMARGRKLLDTKPEPPVEATKKILEIPGKQNILESLPGKTAIKGGKAELTPHEMLQVDVIEYAWELRIREVLPLTQIAIRLQEKYNLPARPSHNTVSTWLQKSWAFKADNIKQYESQLKNEMYAQMQAALQKWLPVALLDNLALRKERILNGQPDFYTDEDSYDEQLKAMQAVIKIWNQMCILFGVSKQQIRDSEDLDAKQLLQIVMNVSTYIHSPPANGAPIDIEAKSDRLELSSGIPHIDGL